MKKRFSDEQIISILREAAARELSLYESQLYNWCSKQQQQMTSSERENELAGLKMPVSNANRRNRLRSWPFSKRPWHISRST